jgi:hypothetical protein
MSNDIIEYGNAAHVAGIGLDRHLNEKSTDNKIYDSDQKIKVFIIKLPKIMKVLRQNRMIKLVGISHNHHKHHKRRKRRASRGIAKIANLRLPVKMIITSTMY